MAALAPVLTVFGKKIPRRFPYTLFEDMRQIDLDERGDIIFLSDPNPLLKAMDLKMPSNSSMLETISASKPGEPETGKSKLKLLVPNDQAGVCQGVMSARITLGERPQSKLALPKASGPKPKWVSPAAKATAAAAAAASSSSSSTAAAAESILVVTSAYNVIVSQEGAYREHIINDKKKDGEQQIHCEMQCWARMAAFLQQLEAAGIGPYQISGVIDFQGAAQQQCDACAKFKQALARDNNLPELCNIR